MDNIPDDFFEPIELEKKQKDWTEKDWAEYWKREQDIINDNFQKHKKKVDAKPKDKLIIRLDERYFHKDTRLVIEFFKTCLKILNFASPLLVRFFPIAGPILWITKGIQALELLLKLKIITRLKMDLQELDKDFAEILTFTCRFVSGCEKSYQNKELEVSDLRYFMPAAKALGPAIAGASEMVFPTGKALNEALELIRLELDLSDDKLEEKAKSVLAISLNLYRVLRK